MYADWGAFVGGWEVWERAVWKSFEERAVERDVVAGVVELIRRELIRVGSRAGEVWFGGRLFFARAR